jgi:hypothetical protein
MYLEVKLGTSPLTKLLIEMEIGFGKKKKQRNFLGSFGHYGIMH